MREFGISVLGRAIYNVTFNEMQAPFAHALAVVHAAHGAEIVVKARIADEHPLLIFSKFPSSTTTTESLSVAELFEHGRTVEYEQLPNLLWATTGYRIRHQSAFLNFGRLRNKIVHFAAPKIDYTREVLKFCAEVIEPMVHDFWKESALAASQDWDDVIIDDGYLAEQFKAHKIKIPKCAQHLFERDAK
jgi:hypothetical protein